MNIKQLAEYTRNYLGGISNEVVDELVESMRGEGRWKGMPGSVIGRFLMGELKISLLYSPRSIKLLDREVFFDAVLSGRIVMKMTNSAVGSQEIRIHKSVDREVAYSILGDVMLNLGIMKYDNQFSGAEAQDYSQSDADIEEDRTIGYKVEE